MRGRFLLAADIGGTFSRFALFRLEENAENDANGESGGGLSLTLLPDSKIKLATHESASFVDLLERLGREETPGGYTLLPAGPRPGYEIVGAAMAVPGPVEHGHCRAANIPWELDKRNIEAVFGVPASLLNDFAAQAHACLFPELLGLHCVLSGEGKAHAPVALLGAGTGLGHALLLPDLSAPAQARKFHAGAAEESADTLKLPASLRPSDAFEALHRRVLPSEGGHAVFGFVGEAEAEFAAFMRRRSGRVEVIGDMAVTGYGLSMLQAFHAKPRNDFEALLPPPEVSAIIDKCPEALEWFARFYGRACRNFVLSTLALGGVYLSGGMLSHLPGLLGHPAFAAEFLFSETKGYLMKDVPVFWISNQDLGLWGAAVSALRLAAV